jgi:coenzyme F420-0:L-glutamate ligase/coenzyme F420-1:gamma-L-glutamate ligase
MIIPIQGMPKIGEGDDISSLIINAIKKIDLKDHDIIVITQKIVSKAEGRMIELASIKPSRRALKLGKELQKDPRVVEMILRESSRILRLGHGVIITETKHGFVCANAGVDQSNVDDGYLSLLPIDPDSSARRIRRRLEKITEKKIAVIITDTFGRPWREGQVDVAIGCSGIRPMESLKGKIDSFGYKLRVTEPAIVDEIAAASELIMKKLSMTPVCIVRGLRYKRSDAGVKSIMRSKELDLFR